MDFVPADFLLSSCHEPFVTDVKNHPRLPEGTYRLVDLYCPDPACDCRKTIFNVHHNGKFVGAIDFGWENLKFYLKWAYGDRDLAKEMIGWSVNHLSDSHLNPLDLIDHFKNLMDEQWLNAIKSNYRDFRKELKARDRTTSSQTSTKTPSRNSPCPCGSGKKFKRCCIDTPREEPATNITPFPVLSGLPDDFSRDFTMDPVPEFDSVVEEKVAEALAHLQKENFEQAREILFPLFDKHPGQASIPYAIGLYHALADRHEESLPYFEDATSLDPEFVEAWYNLGLSYRKATNLPGAIMCAQTVMDLGNPKEDFVIQSKEFIEDMAESIRATTGLELDDCLVNSLTYDTAFLTMQDGEPQKAIEGFEMVLKLEPCHYQSHGNLALCYAMLGDKAKSLNHLYRALKINPSYEVALKNKPLITALKEGEKLDLPMQTVNYGATGLKPI